MSGADRPARVAIYFTPPAESLFWRLGAAWLGRDGASGEAVSQPAIAGLTPAEVFDLTKTARIYGFHYTLKAPFALADGAALGALETALDDLARVRSPFEAPAITAGQHFGFPALLLSERSADMEALAREVVMAFDPFRAASTPEDMARRRGAGLTARQEAQLQRWGYPFIFEDAQFHMTLGEKLSRAVAAPLLEGARAHFAPILGTPFQVEGMALFTQEAQGAPFRMRRFCSFEGTK